MEKATEKYDIYIIYLGKEQIEKVSSPFYQWYTNGAKQTKTLSMLPN